LYIYNIPWEADEKELTDFLNKFTKVEDVTIVREKDTNKSRGFGFATCPDVESANRILKLALQMGKRPLTILPAEPEKLPPKKKPKYLKSGSPPRKTTPQPSIPDDSGCPHLLFVNVTSTHKDFRSKCEGCGTLQKLYVWQCSNCQKSLCKTCKESLEEKYRQDNLLCPHNGGYYRTGLTDGTGVPNIDYEGTCEVCGHVCPDTVWNCYLCNKKFCSKCKNLLIRGEELQQLPD